MWGISMTGNPETQVSKADIPRSEKQRLVAGVFASKAVAENAMEKIRGLSPQLQMMNASSSWSLLRALRFFEWVTYIYFLNVEVTYIKSRNICC